MLKLQLNHRKIFTAVVLVWVITSSFGMLQAQIASGCPATTPLELVVGERGRVLPGGANRVRSAPTTSGNQVALMEGGSVFEVVDGPECADGYRWWQVSYNGQQGWTVEGDATNYFLAPVVVASNTATPTSVRAVGSGDCALEPRLVVGQQGRLTTTTPSRVRDTPSTSGAQVGQVQPLNTFSVLEGPVCAQGINWWRVAVSNLEGWTAEGLDGEYFTEPITPEPTAVSANTATPAPAATTVSSCALEPRLVVGQEGRLTTTTPSRVRDAASGSGAQIGQIQPLDTFTVLEGPVCAQGINWWLISVGRLEGWTAEGVGGDYLTEPIIVEPVSDECLMEPRLQVGSDGIVVSNTPIQTRFLPAIRPDEVTFPLNPQYPFTVLEGPVCAQGINWWRISIVTQPGTTPISRWIAEGLDGVYFVERIIPTPTPTPAYIGIPDPSEISWNSDGSLVAVGTHNDGIFVFDASDWSQPPTQILAGTRAPSLVFDPQNPEQAAASLGNNGLAISLINILSGEEILSLTSTMPGGWYRQLQFSDDGSLLAYDAFGNFVAQPMDDNGELFSVRPPIQNTGDAFNFDRIAISGDGTWMAGTVLVEDSFYVPSEPATGTPPARLHSYLFAGEIGSEDLIAFEDGRIREPVTALFISPDASLIILGDSVGSLRTYTRPEGSDRFSQYNSVIRGQPSSTSNRIYAIALDPNTGAIVTAEGVPNAVVRVFNPTSLTQIAGFLGDESTSVATDLAFSPDGSLLAVIVDDTIRILDTSDYSEVATLVVRRN